MRPSGEPILNPQWWALTESNRGLSSYELEALTNWAKGPYKALNHSNQELVPVFPSCQEVLWKKDFSFRVVAFYQLSWFQKQQKNQWSVWRDLNSQSLSSIGTWVQCVYQFHHTQILGSFKSCLAFGTPFGYFLPPSQEENLQSLTIKLKTLNLGFSKPLCGLHS